MIAIEKKSKTHSNLIENGFSVLQHYHKKISLIKILGKTKWEIFLISLISVSCFHKINHPME